MTIAELDRSDYMEDRKGSLVPKSLVKEIDLLRNDLVMEIVKKSQQVNAILLDFKTRVMADIAAFIDLSAEKYHVQYGGEKGNVQLISYNGKYKVARTIADHIVFDERLQIAKKLIDECIIAWSDGSRSEIKVLVNAAFEVDKAGKISTERVLGLRRLDIKDSKWLMAMDAISDSIQITGSKAYIRIYEQNDHGKFEQINLDLAAI